MSKLRFAFEEASADLDNMDTNARIDADPSPPEEGAQEAAAEQTPGDDAQATPEVDSAEARAEGEEGGDEDEENDLSDPNKPLEIMDTDDLKVMELDDLNRVEAIRNDHKEVVEAVSEDGMIVLKNLDGALEHFLQAADTRARASLQLAAECFAEAQQIAGFGVPSLIQVPVEPAVVDPTSLSTALESIGGTISNIIKALINVLRKAVQFLRDFFRQIWRQIRSLENAIKRRTDELLRYRKAYGKQLEGFARAQGIDPNAEYVELGKNKLYLTFRGTLPGQNKTNDVPDFATAFTDLNVLMAQGADYEKILALLPASCEKFLDFVAQSQDGTVPTDTVMQLFSMVPSFENLMPKECTYAIHAHGVQAPRDEGEESILMVSQEYIGNFYQIGTWPDRDFFARDPNTLDVLATSRVDYRHDPGVALSNGAARAVDIQELEKAQRAATTQAQMLIKLQRVGDAVEQRLERLTEVLKKAEATNWQNNQSDASVAAVKNQQVVLLTRAISSVQGSTQRYFTEVVGHVRNVQYAWYAYLTANLKRDKEILSKGDPRAPKQAGPALA